MGIGGRLKMRSIDTHKCPLSFIDYNKTTFTLPKLLLLYTTNLFQKGLNKHSRSDADRSFCDIFLVLFDIIYV